MQMAIKTNRACRIKQANKRKEGMEMRGLRKVELAPYQQKQMEQVYLREIRKCNEAIKNATKESTKEYIRTVKRKPLIENLRNVRNGYVFE